MTSLMLAITFKSLMFSASKDQIAQDVILLLLKQKLLKGGHTIVSRMSKKIISRYPKDKKIYLFKKWVV